MCGICGELKFDGASPDLRAVERMSVQLARRGPDHAGTFADGPLAFGNRRVAIIWDMRDGHRGSLLLARDRFGTKPLYLTQDGQPGVSVGAARSWS